MTTTTAGTVRSWSADEGWGVVDLDPVVGGGPGLPAVRDVWAHFSAVVGRDFASLVPGERVTVDWEDVPHSPYGGQASAVTVADGAATGSGTPPPGVSGSSLTIEWDDGSRS